MLLTETATVVNGVFECTFTLPESYDNEYDKGYIRYYALDKDRNVEAQGYFDNFTVGGDKQETGIDIIGSPDGALTMVSMPNPAREYVTFVVNGSSNVQSCTVEILDVSGRSVSLLTAANQNRIVWNLTDSNGKKVVAGTYFYRARIITTDGQTHTKSNKIIVLN